MADSNNLRMHQRKLLVSVRDNSWFSAPVLMPWVEAAPGSRHSPRHQHWPHADEDQVIDRNQVTQQVSHKSMTASSEYRGCTELLQLVRKMISRNVLSLVRTQGILTDADRSIVHHCLYMSMRWPQRHSQPFQHYNIHHLLNTYWPEMYVLCRYSK